MSKKKKSGKQRIRISAKRVEDSYDSRGRTSGSSCFDLSKLGDMKFYKPIEGTNKINIIPYEIKTKNHPDVASGKFEIGDADYKLEVYLHRGLGAGNKQSILCRERTYGKSCPICDEARAFREAGKEKEAKSLYASRRVLYNVQPIKKGEAQPVMLWEVSHSLFEKELVEEAKEQAEDQDIINFPDPDEGCIIKFRGTTANIGKVEYLEYKSFSFIDRDEEIDDDVLDSALSLDELIKIPTEDEVNAILNGVDLDEDEDEEEDEPVKKKKSKKVIEEDEEDEDEDEEEDEDEDEDEDEEEDAPIKKKKSKGSEKKKSCKKGKCPHGHKFGIDVDDTPECDDCDVWDECMEASGE